MLFTDLTYVLMRANPLLGQVGGGWALEIWVQMALSLPFQAQKSLARIKNITKEAVGA